MRPIHITLFISFFLINVSVHAQVPLSKKQLEEFRTEALDYVIDFQNFIKEIVQIGNDNKNRANRERLQDVDIEQSTLLFSDSAKIEISNVNGYIKPPITIRDYMKNRVATYYLRYEMTIIEFDMVSNTISDFKPIYNSKNEIEFYEGTFTYVQHFCGIQHLPNIEKQNYVLCSDQDKMHYHDTSVKKGKIQIRRVLTSEGSEWALLLGYISVSDTYP